MRSEAQSDTEFDCSATWEAGRVMAEYLIDIGVFKHVSVERHVNFAVGGCESLRFCYKDVMVSVVSGWIGPGTWDMGIVDVWLYVTGRQAQNKTTQVVPGVRIRSAVAEITPESLD